MFCRHLDLVEDGVTFVGHSAAAPCWYFWQLFPCTYRTFYGDEFGRIHFAVWKMWFGRCYRANDVIVDTFAMTLDDTLRLLDALGAANRSRATMRGNDTLTVA